MTETIKVKTPAKSVFARGTSSGPVLERTILDTLHTISAVTGCTLGPGGHPVLLERPEFGIPPTVTKDGVTVVRSLGFRDPLAHCIYEAVRDVATRTVDAAGDGTTTSVVLAEALTRLTAKFCASNPGVPPQRVVDRVRKFASAIDGLLHDVVVSCRLGDPEGDKRLHAVAKLSANGDGELADVVADAFKICGDLGNVTITEASGAGYAVSRVEGYPYSMGYEDSVGKSYSAFINRHDSQQVVLEKPVFLLYFGQVTDIAVLVPLLDKVSRGITGSSEGKVLTPNVVVVAVSFSEQVLKGLAHNWASPDTLNVLPLALPPTPAQNGQRDLLDDFAAVVNATVFDPVTHPLNRGELHDLGNLAPFDVEPSESNPAGVEWCPGGVARIEMSRYRTTVVGRAGDSTVLMRVGEVEAQLKNAGSQLDQLWIQDRLAKLTGGVAVVTVRGRSAAEVRERKDRVEDAVCAVRGCVRSEDGRPAPGALIGGGWTLCYLASKLAPINWLRDSLTMQGAGLYPPPAESTLEAKIDAQVVAQALLEPVLRLYRNVGMAGGEAAGTVSSLLGEIADGVEDLELETVYDVSAGEWVDAVNAGILDSYPAVTEAVKNAVSLAALVGTLGGAVVQPRDYAAERDDASAAALFERSMAVNPANERA